MFDNLILSLNTVTPVLVLTLLGMFMKKIKLLPDSFYSAADKYVFNLALAALIFKQIVDADLGSGGDAIKLPIFTSILLVCTCTFFSVVTHFTVKNPARVGASVCEWLSAIIAICRPSPSSIGRKSYSIRKVGPGVGK